MIAKRVLFFVPQFPVVSETFIEREASRLSDFEAISLTVVSLEPGSGKLSDNLTDKVFYRRLTIATCIKAFIKYFIFNPKKLWYVHKLVQGEDRVPYFLNFQKDQSLRSSLSVLGRFHNSRLIHFLKGVAYAVIFEEYSPEHLHIHFLSDNSTVGMVAAKLLNIPFSISAHAKDVFVEHTLIPTKAREAKFITVCNGNTWKETIKFANLTKSSGKVKLLFHGIDPKKFFDVPIPNKPQSPFIFTIARLVEKKGIEYLIEASAILKSRGVAHTIKVAGGGPLYELLLAHIKKHGVEEYVKILGTKDKGVPNEIVAGYLQVADIYSAGFIEASDGDIDGVPTTVIEAALAKVPIIATNVGSMSDLVTDQTGYIVPQKNAEALADALEYLINHPSDRIRLGKNAYDQAIKQFNIDKNIGELAELILS